MKFREHCVAAVAAALVASPLAAQGTATFTVDDQGYSFAIPEGYCEPTGPGLVASREVAALDTLNETKVDVQACGTYGEDWTLIKVQRQRQKLPFAKSQFLDLAKSHFESQFGKQMLQDELGQANDMMRDGTDGALEATSSEIYFAGNDEDCAYLEGYSVVAFGDQQKKVLYSSCVTLIGGYTLSVVSYALEEKGVSHGQLRGRARAASNRVSAL